jgi:predicted DNA-binding transcriptional regulator YafY
MLANRGLDRAEVARRVRLLPSGVRSPAARTFALVARALIERRRLRFGYRGRTQAAPEERTAMRLVSPLRLSWYRSNWYLGAWCHGADAFRLFAVERIRGPRIEDAPALELPDPELDALHAEGYGIFAGPALATATVRFGPRCARWVAEETWHPNQEGRRLPDGGYELRIPYSHPQELLMDLLRYGPEAQILAPAELRDAARQRLAEALAAYG